MVLETTGSFVNLNNVEFVEILDDDTGFIFICGGNKLKMTFTNIEEKNRAWDVLHTWKMQENKGFAL